MHPLLGESWLKEKSCLGDPKVRILGTPYLTLADHSDIDLCSALDDLTHAEKVAELLPIQVQQLYVLIRLGKSEDAVKLASQISPKELACACSYMTIVLTPVA